MSDAALRQGREGSRWYSQRPTAEEVVAWFREIPLHEGMFHHEYVSGIVLIPGKEKSDEIVGFDSDGLPQLRERQDLVYTPYIKVETRVAYFWKLLELRPDWRGEIVPVVAPGADTLGLPPGFFRYTAAKPDGKSVSFVGCSMQVRVGERSRALGDGGSTPVMTPPPATKIVATATRWDVDQNALMKAETGAIGRALGFAGILVVPGSGVATAEDMADAAVPAGAAPEPTLPSTAVESTEEDEDALRERAEYLVGQLELRAPEKHEAFQAWARERKLTLAQAPKAMLKGAIRKLERTLDELPVQA